MSQPIPCRLLVDPPQEGAWNMAVDEALLHSAADEGIATLRFYQWLIPTISLGYFQRLADREHHPASRSAAVVRRQSGGGAILHDLELTYSISLPANHPLTKNTQILYSTLHHSLAAVLQSYLNSGDRIILSEKVLAPEDDQPFLCFQRRAEGDLILIHSLNTAQAMSSNKIAGSAQRRCRGAVLQHGSLLLERSPLSPEIPGLNDLGNLKLSATQVTTDLKLKLPQALGLNCFEDKLNQNVRTQAESWYNKKYTNARWTAKR